MNVCVNQTSIGANGCDPAQPHARSFSYDSLKRLSSATNPESGTVSYKYDSDGNLLTKTDARNVITCFGLLSGTSCATGYDALNRLTQKSYSDGTPAVKYTYDPNVQFGKGRLGSIGNGNSVTNYTSFDALGNVMASDQMVTGQTYSFTYTFDLAGSLQTETYPSGRKITTTYDTANRPYTTAGTLAGQQTNYNTQTNYLPHGAVSYYWYGNQVVPAYAYNSRLQMAGLSAMTIDPNDPNNLNNLNNYLLYLLPNWGGTSNNGNLQGAQEAYGPLASLNQLSQTYIYDTANRLRKVTDTDYSRTFCSDAYGNTWVTGYSNIAPAGNTPQMIDTTCPNSTTPYNAKNQINGANYDAAGNQTVVNGNTVTYDAENRQSSATDGVTHAVETYSYDGDGHRVEKAGPNGTVVYVYDALGQLAAEYSTTTNTPACKTCYLVWDHLGSTRLVTDQNAAVISRHDYLPFGEEVGSSGDRTGPWGSTTDVTQKFTGQERDGEMVPNADFFNARYFMGVLGNFTSPDPANAGADLYNPQSWNAYAYVLGNPLNGVDPSGMDACFTYYYTTNGPDGPTGPPVFGSNTTCYPTVPQGQNPQPPGYGPPIGPGPGGGGGGGSQQQSPKNGTQTPQQIQQACINGWYQSPIGKVDDFLSIGGLTWSPNAKENWKEILTLGAAKYLGLGSLAFGANKFNTQTITTLTKTTVIPSSAGAGLTTGLHFIGKVGSVATVVATAGDIMAHGTCAMASDPALANAALQSIP